MKKNMTTKSGVDVKKVANIALAVAAVAAMALPLGMGGPVFGETIPTWLRGHIFF